MREVKEIENGRPAGAAPHLFLEDVREFGQDSGRGNLLGIQTYMQTADYATTAAYRAKLDGYLVEAKENGWLNPKTIAIFPEYIGTWLVVSGEPEAVIEAGSINQVMKRLALRNTGRFLVSLLRAKGQNRVTDSLLRMKAAEMAARYQETFGGLARKYGVTVVAGSILLPEPVVQNGTLAAGTGELQNVSLVFQANGRPYPCIVRKIHPVRDEAPFVGPGPLDTLPVFETPAGRLAVIICADSWYPEVYAALAERGPRLVAVPNNETPDGIWDAPWQGYNPGPMPADVDPADLGRLSNGQAWLKYALPGRMAAAGATAGMHVFFRGQMWDMGGDGHTIIATPGEVFEAAHVQKAALVNYWLPDPGGS